MMLLAMMMVLFAPHANAADLFTVPDTDKSKLWFLDVLFPDNLANSPLASTMTILNSAVLLVGGILAAYTLIAGTMSTAHEGEMLGKKWSSMWLPVRTALGTAMILPAAGGFCAAQVAVLWLITQGVGLADSLWNQYASNPSDGAVITTSASFQQLDSVAKNAFLANVCMKKAQQMWNGSFTSDSRGAGNTGVKPIFKMTETVNPASGAYEFRYGAQGPNEMTTDAVSSTFACGSMILENPAGSSAAKANNAAAANAAMSYNFNYMPSDISSEVSTITTLQAEQFRTMNESMDTLATKYIADNNMDLQSSIDAAVSTYITNINNAVKTQFSNGTKWNSFKEEVQQDGWIMAGAWNMKLIRIQDALNGAAHKVPGVGKQGITYKKIFDARLANIMDKVNQDMAKSASASKYSTGIDANINSGADSNDPNDEFNGKKPSEDDGAKLASNLRNAANESISTALSSFLSGNVINGLKSGSVVSWSSETTVSNLQAVNPLLAMKSIGDELTWAGWGLFDAAGIAGGVAAGAGTVTGNWVSGALSAIMVVMPLVIPLWMAGDTLSVILPMMPYIMWFGVTIGWMVLCLEAMIAAPLWVVVHLHPDGDGVVGRGGAGYSLVLSLTLRPALMIIGLISAYTMLPILGGILNETFSGAFGMVAAGGYVGFIESLAVIGVYVGMMFMIIKKAFSLIHVVPDEILKWIGGSTGQNMGAYAQSAAKGAEAAMFTQAALNQVSQATNGVGGFLRQNDANKRNEADRIAGQGAAAQKNASDANGEFRTHMNAAGPLDQQDEAQSRQTAEFAYNSAQAHNNAGDTKTGQEHMDVAQQAANRAYAFNSSNADLVPKPLQANLPQGTGGTLGKGGGQNNGGSTPSSSVID